MKLSRLANCTRNLTWETRLPEDEVVEPTLRHLVERGASRAQPLPRLTRLEIGAHALVVVGTRVQIRLSYLTPDDERRYEAERLFVALMDAVRAAGLTGAGDDRRSP